MTTDRLPEGVVANDADEARSLHRNPPRSDWSHPLSCGCRECWLDGYEPGSGS